MKGDVLNYDDNVGTGQISGDDGVRYSFTRADLKQLVPIGRGTRVDFDFDGKIAKDIYIDTPRTAASLQTAGVAPAVVAPAAPAEPALGVWGYYIRAYTAKFARFSGRARRKEYWSVALFSAIVFLICYAIIFAGVVGRPIYGTGPQAIYQAMIASPISVVGLILAGIYGLISLLPFVGLLFRRLQDIGWPGWLALIVVALNIVGLFGASVFSMVGGVLTLIISLIPGHAGENKYGPSPK